MVKLKPGMIIAVILVIGWAVFFGFSRNDASKIKKQFHFIADIIEKTGQESPILAAAKVGKLKEVILSPCHIFLPEYGIERDFIRGELSRFVFSIRESYVDVSLRFHDISIKLTSDTAASVSLTSELEGRLKNGEHVGDIHEFSFDLQKTDDTWKIKTIALVEVLQP